MATTQEVEVAPELQRILWACLAYWDAETLAPEERLICYSWVVRPHLERFRETFHQSKLEELARLGLLEKADTSRGGNRRYYRIVEPAQVRGLVQEWNLN
jgi:hypothetical protein